MGVSEIILSEHIKNMIKHVFTIKNERVGALFSITYPKIKTIQRLAWSMGENGMQICKAFHIKKKKK